MNDTMSMNLETRSKYLKSTSIFRNVFVPLFKQKFSRAYMTGARFCFASQGQVIRISHGLVSAEMYKGSIAYAAVCCSSHSPGTRDYRLPNHLICSPVYQTSLTLFLSLPLSAWLCFSVLFSLICLCLSVCLWMSFCLAIFLPI